MKMVIDGASSSVFVGILNSDGEWLAQSEESGAPLESLFPFAEKVLEDADVSLANLSGFIFCAGPGSVLGLRLCAMAIETWTRLFPQAAEMLSYNSLDLTARLLLDSNQDLQDALIVADWKKGAWNAIFIHNRVVGKTEVVDDAAIDGWSGPVYHLPQRKGWQKPPSGATSLVYEPGRLNAVWKQDECLAPCDEVRLYSAGANTFQKWTPERHRAQEATPAQPEKH